MQFILYICIIVAYLYIYIHTYLVDYVYKHYISLWCLYTIYLYTWLYINFHWGSVQITLIETFPRQPRCLAHPKVWPHRRNEWGWKFFEGAVLSQIAAPLALENRQIASTNNSWILPPTTKSRAISTVKGRILAENCRDDLNPRTRKDKLDMPELRQCVQWHLQWFRPCSICNGRPVSAVFARFGLPMSFFLAWTPWWVANGPIFTNVFMIINNYIP